MLNVIPDTPQRNVPAAFDVGLTVLVLCLLAAGGAVIARRSCVEFSKDE